MNITVERADGQKCPRCWRYAGIPENPQGICDRCAKALLEASPEEFYENVKPEERTQFAEQFAALQRQIRAAFQEQYVKYSKPG